MSFVGRIAHARVTAVISAVTIVLGMLATGVVTTAVAPAASATSAPVLEFQRDAARAAWVSGPGGNYFGIWECPQGSLGVGLRGTESGGYVYAFGLVCRYVDLATGTWGNYAYTATTHANPSTQMLCPSGQALVRVDIYTMSGYGYPIASETEPYCQTLDFGNVAATPRTVPQLTGSVSRTPVWFLGGGRSGSFYGRASCGTGKFVVAIDGRRGALLDGLGIYCGAFTSRAATISGVTLSGATQFGVPVTATSTVAGGPTPTTSYQWYRCANADSSTRSTIPAPPECELITGATSSSYTPQITDYGSHLRVVATSENYFGSASMISATTPAPSVPAPSLDLRTSSDSGTSTTDNHTNATTPTIDLGRLVPTATVSVSATNGTTTVSCPDFTAVGVPDDATGAPATGQCQLPALTDGTWTVTTSQTYTPSGGGAPITSTTTSLPIVIDATPPVINPIVVKYGSTTIADDGAIAAPVSNTFTLTAPTATDAHAGVTFTCSIDGKPYATCPTSYTNLTAGEHTLTVRAVDKAGNVSTRDHTWTVVPPLVIDLAPASDSGYLNTDSITNDSMPTYNVTQLAHGATVTLTATKSGSTNQTCTFVADLLSSPTVTSCTFPTSLADGTWTVRGTQTFTPLAGSPATSTTSNTEYLYLDTVAPAFQYFSGPVADGGAVSYSSGAQSGAAVFTDAAGYEYGGTCSVNGGAVQQLTSSETCTLAAPTSGDNRIVFTRFDKAGNISAPVEYNWTNVGSPVVTLAASSDTGSSNTDRTTSDSTPTINVANLTPGAQVTVTAYRSGGGASNVTCTFTAPAAVAPATASSGGCDLGAMTADGSWYFYAAQSFTPSGGTAVSRTGSSVAMTLDTTRPVPTLPTVRAGASTGTVLGNESVTTSTTAWIGAVPAVSGATLQCRLDAVVIACPTTGTLYPNLSVGSHTFEVIATDTAGNVGTTSTTWRVLGKPVVALDPASDTGVSSSDRITRDSTPQINVSNLSGGGGSVTVTATKAGSTVSCTFVPTSTSGSCTLPTAVDGTWSVSAVESVTVGASTFSSSPADAIAVTIDTVAPVKPSAGLAADGSAITSGGVVQLGAGVTSGSVTFTSAPTSEAGAVIACQLDGGTSATCPVGGLGTVANGVHALTMTAVDLAGNESSSVVQWFQVEAITLGLAPSGLSATSSGMALTNSRTQTVNLTGLAGLTPVTVTATSGGQTITCQISGETSGAGSCDLQFPADGTWTISATDKDGNALPVGSTSLVVDTTKPTLTASIRDPGTSELVAGTAGSATSFRTATTTLSLTTAASDAIGPVTTTCALAGNAAGSCPTSLTNLTYGTHNLVVTATDAAGNTDVSTLTWYVTAPPTVALAAASDSGSSSSDGITNDSTPTITVGNLGQDVDVVVTARKAGQPDVSCYLWHANDAGPVPGTASCNLGTLVDGSWSITATQTVSGRPEWISPASPAATVVIDTVAPTAPTSTFAGGISSGTTTTSTSLVFSSGPTSTDASTIAYTCSLDGGASGACGSLSGLSAGTHTLASTATDLAGNASTSRLSWTILGPPVVDLPAASDTGASSSDNVTNATSPVISVSSLIPGALVTVRAVKGSETITCSFLAGPPASPSDPSSTGECTLPGLTSDGAWSVTATQSISGTASVASSALTVTLDTTAPVVGGGTTGITAVAGAVAGGPAVAPGAGTESTSILFTLPGSEFTSAQLSAGATRTCLLDFVAIACPTSAITGLSTGSHTLAVRDSDVAGNVTTETFTWSVVGVPTVALSASSDSAARDSITNDDTPEFSAGSLIEGATVEIVATQGSSTVSCSFVVAEGVTSCDLPPMVDGPWTVKARQGFGSGWSAFSGTVPVTIDATAPSDLAATLSASSAALVFQDGDETASASSNVSVAAPMSTDASTVTYTCALNGATAAPCSTSYTGLPSGANALTITATDVAGNVSSLRREWTVVAPPVIALASSSDTGMIGDGVTSQERPEFEVSNLVPGASVTVTASRVGETPVTCTFIAPSVVAPSTSSAGSCALGQDIGGLGWSIYATQRHTSTTADPSDAVTVTSGASTSVALDVVQPHEVVISAPTTVSVAVETLTLETRSVAMPFESVTLTSLTPAVCTVNADGDVVLLAPGTCTLRGTAPGGDDGGGVFYDVGRREVSFTVEPSATQTTVPVGSVLGKGIESPSSVTAAITASRPTGNNGAGAENGAASTVGLIAPPPPVRTVIQRLPNGRQAQVTITVRQDKPGAPVRSVVLLVFDERGAKVRQTAVDVPAGETVVTTTVPFREDGYQVRSYTTNEAGVSNRAPIGANVLERPTVLGKRKDGTPILFGKEIAKPILFDPDSPALDGPARRTLDGVVRYAAKNGGRVFITGFVLNGGGSVRDQKELSSSRAEQVAMYLSKRGVDTWIRFNGYGAYRKGQGQPQDRRVEVRWSDEEIPGLVETRANPVVAPGSSGAGSGR